MSNKQSVIRLELNSRFDKTLNTEFVAWSRDKESYKFLFEFGDGCGNPLILEDAKPRILLEFNEGIKQIYSLDIDSKQLGLATFTLPNRILGYDGFVKASVYVDYEKLEHDLGNFRFKMKKSHIDCEMPELQFYVSEFDEGLKQWEEKQKEVNDMSINIEEKIGNIEEKIEKNDLLTNSEYAVNEKKIDDKFIEINSIVPSASYYWSCPKMADTRRGNGLVPVGYNPDEHLDALIQPLADGFPEYVKRKDLGKTQDGDYTIRRYDFVPEKYEKTIILTACLHGNEYTGFYALAQFLELLCKRYNEFPQLAYLRKNVRIITVPIINMWGFENQKRQNSRGVDMNRNFPLYWDSFSSDKPGNTYYKGTSPLSEAETRIIANMLQEFDDAVSHMDFHTTNVVEGEYVLYYPRHLKNQTHQFVELVNKLKKDGETEVWSSSKLPEFTTHACHVHDMNVANPEFVNTTVTAEIRSSEEMQRAVEWFGNVVIEASKLKKPSSGVVTDPLIKLMTYDKKGDFDTSFTHKVFNNLDYTYLSFSPPTAGTLKFTGSVMFEANDLTEGKEVSFFPNIYQVGTSNFSFNETKDNPFLDTSIISNGAGHYVLPIQNAIFVEMKTDKNQRAGDCVVRIRAKTGGGRVTVKKINGILEFIPANTGERFEIYSSTSNESLGTNAMKKTFPNNDSGENVTE